MKSIKTLAKDIYALFDPKTTSTPSEEHLDQFANNLKNKIKEKMAEVTLKPTLRMSNLGTKCTRQLWYKINMPGKGEEFTGHTYLKFLFGDIIEELILLLAKTAGHEVKNEQTKLQVGPILGSCDATIDGVLVDVKSASSFSFKKFEDGLTRDTDSFGYLTQLGLYNHALKQQGFKGDNAAFVAFDKQNGSIAVDVHGADINSVDYDKLVADKIALVSEPDPPPRSFLPLVEDNGNEYLGVECSYCPFKETCWPGLTTYFYSRGPRFFTKIKKEPRVQKKAD